jgi:hypothetical protein
MTKTELLSNLRQMETILRSSSVQTFFKQQDPQTRARFASLMNNLSVAVNRISNEQMQMLADRLDELNDDLIAGIENVEEKLHDLDDAVAIMNTVSTVLSLVSRLVGVFI